MLHIFIPQEIQLTLQKSFAAVCVIHRIFVKNLIRKNLIRYFSGQTLQSIIPLAVLLLAPLHLVAAST